MSALNELNWPKHTGKLQHWMKLAKNSNTSQGLLEKHWHPQGNTYIGRRSLESTYTGRNTLENSNTGRGLPEKHQHRPKFVEKTPTPVEVHRETPSPAEKTRKVPTLEETRCRVNSHLGWSGSNLGLPNSVGTNWVMDPFVWVGLWTWARLGR